MAILGIRGLPAAHGGFETFAEYLSTHFVQRGWQVTVYCQVSSGEQRCHKWQGIELVDIPVSGDGAASTIVFDIKSTVQACQHHDLLLTLGYNTGFLALYTRLKGVTNVINMDGIEWQRSKWSLPIKIWFYINERFAGWAGNHLVADHPEICSHLAGSYKRNKITTIPYGAEEIEDSDDGCLHDLGVRAQQYALVIARPEPENSILEIVRAYTRAKRNYKLILLGKFEEGNRYHREVKQAANDDVVFAGAIYDKNIVQALRFYAHLYIHGHQVGGTNPSLLESMAAGSAIVAHDNRFNRWVTGNKATYFKDEQSLSDLFGQFDQTADELAGMRDDMRELFEQRYQWSTIIDQYEQMLLRHLPETRV